ncbi:CorA family Mg2+ transporter protein [Besnoitia besnoiti]|uniref:CorA family Mg2+ transporter protein n=1 Tax=Besnoitia besnoiti TaxID=94643 RepID=A0A2A9MK33_BESBE|nr:CorA family Mg2+ transporter protein [Besnoitia besnoiti]PFH35762.1 CorA family Mg2+ transporter protein [Besnoitia besnoiti]
MRLCGVARKGVSLSRGASFLRAEGDSGRGFLGNGPAFSKPAFAARSCSACGACRPQGATAEGDEAIEGCERRGRTETQSGEEGTCRDALTWTARGARRGSLRTRPPSFSPSHADLPTSPFLSSEHSVGPASFVSSKLGAREAAPWRACQSFPLSLSPHPLRSLSSIALSGASTSCRTASSSASASLLRKHLVSASAQLSPAALSPFFPASPCSPANTTVQGPRPWQDRGALSASIRLHPSASSSFSSLFGASASSLSQAQTRQRGEREDCIQRGDTLHALPSPLFETSRRRQESEEASGPRNGGLPAGFRPVPLSRAQLQVCVIEASAESAFSSPSPSSPLSRCREPNDPGFTGSAADAPGFSPAGKKAFRCHYTALSRHQLATDLQLPYSDIRLLDVVRVPSAPKLPRSLSGGLPAFPSRAAFAGGGAAGGGAAGGPDEETVYARARREGATDPHGGDREEARGRGVSGLFSFLFPAAKTKKRDRLRSRGRGDDFDRDEQGHETPRQRADALAFFPPAGLEAMKLQHAKILVRRTAILVQIENIAAVITPRRLILLHPHPTVTSALLHQLTCGDASPHSTASLLECGSSSCSAEDESESLESETDTPKRSAEELHASAATPASPSSAPESASSPKALASASSSLDAAEASSLPAAPSGASPPSSPSSRPSSSYAPFSSSSAFPSSHASSSFAGAWSAGAPRELPFELRALEALLAVALGSLDALATEYVDRVRHTIAALEQESAGVSRDAGQSSSNAWSLATADATLFTLLHSPSLHQLMVLKNVLQDVEARVDAFRVCLSKLLSDDGDMADMYLTDRLIYTIPHAREDHADVELVLEGSLQQVDALLYDILTAKRCVIHHEELTKMRLDVCRNAYMQMNVKISLFSLTTSVAAVIAGIFGMNLPLFEQSGPQEPPSHPPSPAPPKRVVEEASRPAEDARLADAGFVRASSDSQNLSAASQAALSSSPPSPTGSGSDDVGLRLTGRAPASRSAREMAAEARGSSHGSSPAPPADSSSSRASGLPDRHEENTPSFSAASSAARHYLSLEFVHSLLKERRAAVDGVREELMEWRKAFSLWLYGHSFFLVSCCLILPICVCGFVFCNRLARIFALHGCRTSDGGAASSRRSSLTKMRKALASLSRARGDASALAPFPIARKFTQRPLFLFPSLFCFNRLPPSHVMPGAKTLPLPPEVRAQHTKEESRYRTPED